MQTKHSSSERDQLWMILSRQLGRILLTSLNTAFHETPQKHRTTQSNYATEDILQTPQHHQKGDVYQNPSCCAEYCNFIAILFQFERKEIKLWIFVCYGEKVSDMAEL